MSRDFQQFFKIYKTLPGPHMNRQQRFSEIFRCRDDIREKRVSTHNGLRCHSVSVVNDKADIVLA